MALSNFAKALLKANQIAVAREEKGTLMALYGSPILILYLHQFEVKFFLFVMLLFFPLSYHTTVICDILMTSCVPLQNIEQMQSQAILWHQAGMTQGDLVIVKCVHDLRPTTHRDHSCFTKPRV